MATSHARRARRAAAAAAQEALMAKAWPAHEVPSSVTVKSWTKSGRWARWEDSKVRATWSKELRIDKASAYIAELDHEGARSRSAVEKEMHRSKLG
jgi:hypothetical protein